MQPLNALAKYPGPALGVGEIGLVVGQRRDDFNPVLSEKPGQIFFGFAVLRIAVGLNGQVVANHDVFAHRYGLLNEFVKTRMQLRRSAREIKLGNLKMLLKDFKALHNAF